ncbi:MAG: SDR family oxidoreductase [Clostridia bacterium]|nr:SDR family oxidoreductase [Clostridia bacterium]
MTALITGASSGIGRDMARVLAKKGVSLILVARRTEPMEALKNELSVPVEVISCDLSKKENIYELYGKLRDRKIDILINNAGFGVFGRFCDTDLDRETDMIATNVTAMHMMMKLFLRDMKERNSGYILNVASSAAFLPGPLFSSYYASKAYIHRLTQAVEYELKREGSKVYIGSLCPGPIKTNFDEVANVKFSLPMLSSEFVAEYAIKKMFAKQKVIVPGFSMKAGRVLAKLAPENLQMFFAYNTQRKKFGADEK